MVIIPSPINYINQKKRQRYLALIFLALVLVTVIIWQVFFKKKETITYKGIAPAEKVKIDFGALENQALKDLKTFTPINKTQEQTGRQNPFLPY